MTPQEALEQLKRGNSVDCVTPAGVSFRIASKLSYGLAWYRTYPTRKGCLNRFSRLSDGDMLQWLGSVVIMPTNTVERTVAQMEVRR